MLRISKGGSKKMKKVVMRAVEEKETGRLKVFCGRELMAIIHGKVCSRVFDKVIGEWHLALEDTSGHYLGILWADEVKGAEEVSSVQH